MQIHSRLYRTFGLLLALGLPTVGFAQGGSSGAHSAAQEQLQQAREFVESGQTWRSIKPFDSAWTLFREAGDRPGELDVLTEALGVLTGPSLAGSTGSLEQLYPLAARAFALANDFDRPQLKLRAITTLLDCAPIEDGSLARWTPYIDTGLAVAGQLGDSLEMARFMNRKAAWLHMSGHPDAAIPLWEKAEALYGRHGEKSDLLEFCYNVGTRWMVFPRVQSYEQAYKYYTKARELCLETNDSSQCAYQALALVVPSFQLGYDDEGAAHVAEFFRWLPQTTIEDSLRNLSYVVTRLDAAGQYETASDWCDTLIAAYREMDQEVYLSTVFGLKADVLTDLERYDVARAYYDSSAQISQRHGGAINEAVQAAIGAFFLTNDRPDSAAGVFRRLLYRAAERGPHSSEIRYKLALAEALVNMDSSTAALPLFREALDYCRTSEEADAQQRYGFTLRVGSRAFRKLNQPDSALYYLDHWRNFAESTLAYSDLLYIDSIRPIIESER